MKGALSLVGEFVASHSAAAMVAMTIAAVLVFLLASGIAAQIALQMEERLGS